MPEIIVTHDGPPPRQLTAEENAQRLEGLRVPTRIIVHHHNARQEQLRCGEDCDRDAASGTYRPSTER